MSEAKKTKPQGVDATMDRLEQVVRKLESKDLPLEEALKLFSEGNELYEQADKRLRDMEKQVEIIVNKRGDTESFDVDDQ